MSVEKRQIRQDSDVIDLARLAKVVLKKLWLVIAVALLFGSGAYIGTKVFIAPTYTSSFTAYVNNKTEQESTTVTSSDVTAARSLVSTYSAIFVSQPILEDAAKNAGIDMSYDVLSEAVTTSTVDDTEIIEISVTMEDPENALAFADALAEVAPSYIAKIVEGSSMQVVESPQLPTTISGPNYLRNTAEGFVLGALLVIAVIVLKDMTDDRVKNEEELENRYGITVMGTIPDLVEAQKTNFSGYKARKE